jgi:DNA-binding SARP family transcriptional activator
MRIRLFALGGLRVFAGERELPSLLAQRQRTALLVYLAVERRVSREALLAMFWPESDEENARHALRQSLYSLKRALGDDWLEAQTLELRVTEELECDVGVFERGPVAHLGASRVGPPRNGGSVDASQVCCSR